MKTIGLFTICLLVMPIGGCLETTDPDTGKKTVSLDPNAAATGEGIAEAGIALAPLFGAAGLAVATALAGALATWRKVKPGLMQARTEAEQGHAAGAALVEAIGEFRKTNPEQWDKLGGLIEQQIAKQGMDPKTVENFIRGLRGLSPKA